MYKDKNFSGSPKSCDIENHDSPAVNFRFSNRLPAQYYKGDGTINEGLPGLGLYQKAPAYGEYVSVHQDPWKLPITDGQVVPRKSEINYGPRSLGNTQGPQTGIESFSMPLYESHITYPITEGESKMVLIVTVGLLLLVLYFFKEL